MFILAVFVVITIALITGFEFMFRRWLLQDRHDIPRDLPFPPIVRVIFAVPAGLIAFAITCLLG